MRISVHKSMQQLAGEIAAEFGLIAGQDQRGNIVLRPKHTNAGIRKFPSRRGQFGGTTSNFK